MIAQWSDSENGLIPATTIDLDRLVSRIQTICAD